MLKYRKSLFDMPSYDVAERDWRIKINANEAPTVLPPLVEERVLTRLSRVAFNRYPNHELDDLGEQIADRYAVNREQVFFGNGSSEIIEKLFFCFGGSRHTIVYPAPSFSMYRIYVKAADAKGVPVELESDYSLDREKFVRTVNEQKASLAVVCNPNNPTGNLTGLEDIEYIAKNINCAFVVDEAYIEFAGEKASAVQMMKNYPNLIIARTFSKAYGMAAARVGYAIANESIASMIKKAFMPYHLNVLSLAAADIVYQMRDEFLPRIYMLQDECRRVVNALKNVPGLTVYPSCTNFVLFRYAFAQELNSYLEERGIGVRSFGNAPRLENCLRVSMGTREENDEWMAEVERFIKGKQ